MLVYDCTAFPLAQYNALRHSGATVSVLRQQNYRCLQGSGLRHFYKEICDTNASTDGGQGPREGRQLNLIWTADAVSQDITAYLITSHPFFVTAIGNTLIAFPLQSDYYTVAN